MTNYGFSTSIYGLIAFYYIFLYGSKEVALVTMTTGAICVLWYCLHELVFLNNKTTNSNLYYGGNKYYPEVG
jgi:hypothetical protein